MIPKLSIEQIERTVLRRIFWYKFWRRLVRWIAVSVIVGSLLVLPWLFHF